MVIGNAIIEKCLLQCSALMRGVVMLQPTYSDTRCCSIYNAMACMLRCWVPVTFNILNLEMAYNSSEEDNYHQQQDLRGSMPRIRQCMNREEDARM